MSKLTQVNINKAMNVETKYTPHAINILSSILKCMKRISTMLLLFLTY